MTFHNGISEASPLLAKHCGGSIPHTNYSQTNMAFIHFQSGGSVTGTGFELEYTPSSKFYCTKMSIIFLFLKSMNRYTSTDIHILILTLFGIFFNHIWRDIDDTWNKRFMEMYGISLQYGGISRRWNLSMHCIWGFEPWGGSNDKPSINVWFNILIEYSHNSMKICAIVNP